MVHSRTKLQTVFTNIKVLLQGNVNYLYTYIYKQFIVIIMLQSLFNFCIHYHMFNFKSNHIL